MCNIQSLIVSINILLGIIANLSSYMKKILEGISPEEKDGRGGLIFDYSHFERCFFTNLNDYKDLLNSMLFKLKIMAAHKIYCNESYEKQFVKIQKWFMSSIKWANQCIMMTRFGAGENCNAFINKTSNDNLPLKINIKGLEDENNYEDEWLNVSSSIPYYNFKLVPADIPGIQLFGKPTRSYKIDGQKFYSFMEAKKLWRAEYELEKEIKGKKW